MKKQAGRLDFRQMSETQRYVHLGTVILVIVFICFFAGLAIDFILKQEATVAIWGVWLGSALALAYSVYQLRKLVEPAAKATKKPARRDTKLGKDGLSKIEKDILAAEKTTKPNKSIKSAKTKSIKTTIKN